MPTYKLSCPKCGYTAYKRLSFQAYQDLQKDKKEISCPACSDTVLQVDFDPGKVDFSLLDGPSGGWTTKAIKENIYRAKRWDALGRKKRDNIHTPKLQPNYNGVETDTWRDAQEEARKEKGDLAASTYAPLVQGED